MLKTTTKNNETFSRIHKQTFYFYFFVSINFCLIFSYFVQLNQISLIFFTFWYQQTTTTVTKAKKKKKVDDDWYKKIIWAILNKPYLTSLSYQLKSVTIFLSLFFFLFAVESILFFWLKRCAVVVPSVVSVQTFNQNFSLLKNAGKNWK